VIERDARSTVCLACDWLLRSGVRGREEPEVSVLWRVRAVGYGVPISSFAAWSLAAPTYQRVELVTLWV